MEILELAVTDLSRGGAGVSKDPSGRVIFIPFTAPGDIVRAEILWTKKKFAQARIIEILKPSQLRIQPRCPAFSRCGGCQWQHLAYDQQWKTKVQGVQHALQRVQLPTSNSMWKEFPAEQIWEYRNRVQLRGFRDQLGFYAAQSHDLVPLNRCDITRSEINAVWNQIREEGINKPVPFKVEISILPNGEIRTAWNSAHSATGFMQIHEAQNQKLIRWIQTRFDNPTHENNIVLDLYGGAGNLSIPLAPRMSEIHCVDVSTPSLPPPFTPQNIQFHRSKVSRWMIRQSKTQSALKAIAHSGRKLIAIFDPPREGLKDDFYEIARALDTLLVQEIILVGCEPDPWARDLSRFIKRKWHLSELAIFDFFPQTPHVESAAHLYKTI